MLDLQRINREHYRPREGELLQDFVTLMWKKQSVMPRTGATVYQERFWTTARHKSAS